jgi:hypothetical protein
VVWPSLSVFVVFPIRIISFGERILDINALEKKYSI